jgi:predicted MFS family arabinose efflux permease
VLVATALIFSAGLVMMVNSAAFPGGLTLAGFLLGVGTTGFGTLYGAISRKVPAEKRSQTIGLVAAAGSLGTMVLAPIAGRMIDASGWKFAMLVFAGLAVCMAVFALPIREVPKANPSEKKASLKEAVQEAIGHRGYLFMTLAFFACGFQLVFLTTHLPAYLALCGIAPGVGATALGLIGLFNAIGTYIFGQLGARYSQKHLLAMIYLLRTLFIVVFLAAPPRRWSSPRRWASCGSA